MSWMVVAMSVVMAACSGDGGNDDGPIPMDQYDEAVAAAVCANIFDCCDAAERPAALAIFLDPAPETEAACRDAAATYYRQNLAADAVLAGGRATYDGEAVADCVAAIETAACGLATMTAERQHCATYLAGTVATGGMCRDRQECASHDDYCDLDHVCAPIPAVGDECPSSVCVEGAHCTFSVTCEADKANGVACTGNTECISRYCDSSGVCLVEPETTTCDGN